MPDYSKMSPLLIAEEMIRENLAVLRKTMKAPVSSSVKETWDSGVQALREEWKMSDEEVAGVLWESFESCDQPSRAATLLATPEMAYFLGLSRGQDAKVKEEKVALILYDAGFFKKIIPRESITWAAELVYPLTSGDKDLEKLAKMAE